jgi:hypothetical protein
MADKIIMWHQWRIINFISYGEVKTFLILEMAGIIHKFDIIARYSFIKAYGSFIDKTLLKLLQRIMKINLS